jgi:flagellin
MTIKIGSNIDSLRAQRRLDQSSTELNTTLRRLSSGQRINKASDDAAGNAVAQSLNLKSKVSTKAIDNINQGINLTSVADGALAELSDLAMRIRELAAQGSTGALSASQRAAIDKEAQALSREYTRIVQTTEYNGTKLFNGKQGDLRIQTGFGTSGFLGSSLGGSVGTGSFNTAVGKGIGSVPFDSVLATDLNKDGKVDFVGGASTGGLSVSLGFGNGTFSTVTSLGSPLVNDIASADFNGDGRTDIVTANYSTGAGVYLGNGDGTFAAAIQVYSGDTYSISTGDFNGDGNSDLILGKTGISLYLGNGKGGFTYHSQYDPGGGYPINSLVAVDLNNDSKLDLVAGTEGGLFVLSGNGSGGLTNLGVVANSITISDVSVGDINNDGRKDIAILDGGAQGAEILMANSSGGFTSSGSIDLGDTTVSSALGDLNGDGLMDLVYTTLSSGDVGVLYNQGGSLVTNQTASFAFALSDITLNDFDGDGVLDLLGAGSNAKSVFTALGQSTSGVSALVPFSLFSQEESRQAVSHLDRTISNLAAHRGQIGALQSRLGMAANVSSANRQESTAAYSRIMDADIASEVAKSVRATILQNSATSVLAQANQNPALALTLLRG